MSIGGGSLASGFGFGRIVARAGPVVLLIAFSTTLGCASTELRAYESAQADYEACRESHADEPARCAILKDAARQRYSEYEAAAKNRWGGEWRDEREHPWGKE
jgi:hypothetical protein